MVNIKASKVHRSVKVKKRHFQSFQLSKTVILLAVLFILLLILGLSRLNLLTVKEISIKQQNLSCVSSDQVKNEANILNKSFFKIDEEGLKKKFYEKYPCIKNISLEKSLPDKVLLDIEERSAAFLIRQTKITQSLNLGLTEATSSSDSAKFIGITELIKDASPSGSFVVDQEGFIFSDFEIQNLPEIKVFDDQLRVGYSFNSGDIGKVFEIQEGVKNLQLQTSGLNIINGNLILDGVPKVIFSLKKDVKSQVASLQLILQKAKINSVGSDERAQSPIEIIDLRFDRAVVKYGDKK